MSDQSPDGLEQFGDLDGMEVESVIYEDEDGQRYRRYWYGDEIREEKLDDGDEGTRDSRPVGDRDEDLNALGFGDTTL